MILAIGTDLVSIPRIARAMMRSGFAERVLTDREREREVTAEYLAGRWAAKEAAFKCVPGLQSFRAVEIVPDDSGRLKAIAALPPNTRLLVSISHEGDYALAFAVFESS